MVSAPRGLRTAGAVRAGARARRQRERQNLDASWPEWRLPLPRLQALQEAVLKAQQDYVALSDKLKQ